MFYVTQDPLDATAILLRSLHARLKLRSMQNTFKVAQRPFRNAFLREICPSVCTMMDAKHPNLTKAMWTLLDFRGCRGPDPAQRQRGSAWP